MNSREFFNYLFDNGVSLEEVITAARKVKTERDAEMEANKQRTMKINAARTKAVDAMMDYLKLVVTKDDFDFEEMAEFMVNNFKELEEQLKDLAEVMPKSCKGACKKEPCDKSCKEEKSDDVTLSDFLRALRKTY